MLNAESHEGILISLVWNMCPAPRDIIILLIQCLAQSCNAINTINIFSVPNPLENWVPLM